MTQSVADILRHTNRTLFSFEVLPPLKGKGIGRVFDTIDTLMPFNPAFIEVTTHRSEFVYHEVAPGQFVRKKDYLRPGTVAVASAIKQKYDIPVVPHLICSGTTQEETENELIDLSFFDIMDIFLLRGDKSKQDNRFIPEKGGLSHASELCHQINEFNKGSLLFGEAHSMLDGKRPFTYGVAAYPEKHEEAMSLQMDIEMLKRKVDMGAGYIITQMFFDNRKFLSFVERCRKSGITVPIIPGLKPISTLNHCTMLPRVFHIDFPSRLVRQLAKCETNANVKQTGIEWATRQCEELKAAGVPCLHFYSMNAAESIARIMENLQ